MSQKRYVIDAPKLKMRRRERDLTQGQFMKHVAQLKRDLSLSYLKKLEKELDEKRKKFAAKKQKGGEGDDWMNIFDTGDAQVRDSLG